MFLRSMAGYSRTTVKIIKNIFLLFLARISYRFIGIIFLVFIFSILFSDSLKETTKFAAAEVAPLGISPIKESFETTQVEIPFKKSEIADSSLKEGEKKVVQTGKTGLLEKNHRILSLNGQELTRETTEVLKNPPTTEVVAFGTQKAKPSLAIEGQEITYLRKLSMLATSYDPNCKGCNGITAIGLKAGYGIVAVDPKVIKLRSKLFIPGYGFAIAGDTGGSIKGNKIDLGFDDVKKGWWSKRHTDVYILSE